MLTGESVLMTVAQNVHVVKKKWVTILRLKKLTWNFMWKQISLGDTYQIKW